MGYRKDRLWRWGKWTAAVFILLLVVPPHSGDPYVLLGQLLAAGLLVALVGAVAVTVRRLRGRARPG